MVQEPLILTIHLIHILFVDHSHCKSSFTQKHSKINKATLKSQHIINTCTVVRGAL